MMISSARQQRKRRRNHTPTRAEARPADKLIFDRCGCRCSKKNFFISGDFGKSPFFIFNVTNLTELSAFDNLQTANPENNSGIARMTSVQYEQPMKEWPTTGNGDASWMPRHASSKMPGQPSAPDRKTLIERTWRDTRSMRNSDKHFGEGRCRYNKSWPAACSGMSGTVSSTLPGIDCCNFSRSRWRRRSSRRYSRFSHLMKVVTSLLPSATPNEASYGASAVG